jgi:hypothetical protein
MRAPPLTHVEMVLVSPEKEVSQENLFVFDLLSQVYPEGLSGAITVGFGNKVFGREGYSAKFDCNR